MTLPANSSFNSIGTQSGKGETSSGVEVFDLDAEIGALGSSHEPERTARTLTRLDTLRLTLMKLKSGADVKQHHTDHELSIQTISGRITIDTAQQSLDLPRGHVAILRRGIVHRLHANEESAILVVVGMQCGNEQHRTKPETPLAED